MLELVQYRPQTPTVRVLPLLIVPPTINKYYVLDLAPGRSLVEYLIRQGQQVFVVSWRNPDARHSTWGFDAYATAIIKALDAVAEICGVDSAHVIAACSGGILASITAAYLATTGRQDKLASLSLLVTMIDQSRAGTTGALIDETVAAAAVAKSQRKGYLDGRQLAEVFAWLRPGDLVWNYWVNNYLQGRKPPKFDILFWNADTTRMTASLHRDFVNVAIRNSLARPGGAAVLDTEIDLRQIRVDSYVVAGVADHICPWQSCYRSSQLLGGKTRFVLSTSGHIAALVNPPGNAKASCQVSDENSLDPQDWKRETRTEKGSWWDDYAAWLAARRRPATRACGCSKTPPAATSWTSDAVARSSPCSGRTGSSAQIPRFGFLRFVRFLVTVWRLRGEVQQPATGGYRRVQRPPRCRFRLIRVHGGVIRGNGASGVGLHRLDSA